VTTIRATCPTCGEVDLKPPDVDISDDEAFYSFVCPKCEQLIDKTANERIIALLRGAGVGEFPPITNRDVLLFSSNFDEEMEQLLR